MRVIFVGSQELGKLCLEELLKKDEVSAVFTISPKKHEKWKNEVAILTKKNNIPLYVNENINDYVDKIKKMNLDAMFVMGWRKIISSEILNASKLGCFGIHCSLLPKYRGNAPFTWPIIMGEKKTGTTLFKMDETADTGDIVIQKKCEILENDTGGTLQEKLFELSIKMLREVLPSFRNGKIPLITQKHEGFSYFGPRKPEDGIIDWNKTSMELYNFIRALAPPFPMAFTSYNGRKIFITKASIANGYYGVPGSVITELNYKMVIATRDDGLLIEDAFYEDTKEYPKIKHGEKLGISRD